MRKTLVKLIALLTMIMYIVGSAAFADVSSFDPSKYSDEELVQIRDIITDELYARKQAWAEEHGDRKITFENNEISIARGKKEKVVPTITRNIDTAPEKTKLIWTSDDEAVATVKDGSVLANGVGSCHITCYAEDNEFIKSVMVVNVFEPVKNIKSDITQATVEIGSFIVPNITFDPVDATYQNIEWISSDETIAEVSPDLGRITALKNGDCVVTAKSTDGSEKKADIKIHVPAFAVAQDEYHFSESDGVLIPVVYSGINYSDLKISGENDAKIISWSVDSQGIRVLPKRRGECSLKISHGKDTKTIKIFNEISSLDANKALAVGDIVTFGSYEQDDNTGNGKEAIKWEITEINGSTATLTSKYILDFLPYAKNSKEKRSGDILFRDSSLYSWLNKNFKNAAFSSDDAEAIVGDVSIPQIVIGEKEALIVKLNQEYASARMDKRERNGPGMERVKYSTTYASNKNKSNQPNSYWCNNGEMQSGSNGNIVSCSLDWNWGGAVPVIKIDLSAVILTPVKD